MNAFHVLGIVLAAWAVLLTALGLRHGGFPGKRGERVVSALSILLVAAAIAAGTISSAVEKAEEHEMVAEEQHKLAEEHSKKSGEVAPGVLPGGVQKLELSADPGGKLRFDKDRLEVRPGKTTLVMANPSPLPHNIVLEGHGIEREGTTVGTGGTSTVSADLGPGRYRFYCSVLGHHEGGMEGTLSVR